MTSDVSYEMVFYLLLKNLQQQTYEKVALRSSVNSLLKSVKQVSFLMHDMKSSQHFFLHAALFCLTSRS
jgi:hypothetical protein